MRRSLLLGVVLLGVGGCVHSARVTDYRFQFEDNLRSATVYIRNCGTGWLANDHYVVTNAHIADCIKERHNGYATVDFLDGSSMNGEEIGRSSQPYVDLAIIRLNGRVQRTTLPVYIEPETLPRDTLLLSMGNPAPSRWIPTTYRVLVQPRQVDGGLNGVIVLEGAAYYGDSGSPVVNLDGRVVGVLFARSEGHAYAVPVNPYLVDLIREIQPVENPLDWRP